MLDVQEEREEREVEIGKAKEPDFGMDEGSDAPVRALDMMEEREVGIGRQKGQKIGIDKGKVGYEEEDDIQQCVD